PKWVVLDNTLELLDADSRQRIESILETSFTDVGIVNLAHEEISPNFFTRSLNLINDPSGSTFQPNGRNGIPDLAEPRRETLSAQ
ncbi:MAG TPA: hypothetical protein VG271_00620, partial [Beijerinckiaceae bacterium]|nr:hypothetical protein [Beijerinckiaceae bacterium]